MKRRLLMFMVCSLVAIAQTPYATVTTVPDITGDSSTHQLQASGSARWIQFIAQSGNSAVIRVGDSSTSSSHGLPLAAGSGQMFPPLPQVSGQTVQGVQYYDLSKIYYYATTGDKLSVMFGN